MIDLDATVLPWIGRSIKVLDCYISERFAQNGINLTKVQWLLLKVLKKKNGESQHNLAFLTNRDKASLTRLLTTMERKNLVARVPSQTDQRVNCIYLTTQGEKMLKKTMPILEDIVREVQQNISQEDRILVVNTLKKIIENVQLADNQLQK